MTLQTKSANARHCDQETVFSKYEDIFSFNIHYSKIIFKFEIVFIVTLFISLFSIRQDIWFIPALFLYCLITYIFFKRFSIIRQFPQQLNFEFRKAPDRLICYDLSSESTYLFQDIDVLITRWFIILKLTNSTKRWQLVLLQDSFDSMNHYTSFRRKLLLSKKRCI